MRLVLDTNTLISAIGWTGPPRQILVALLERRHALVTTPDLLRELSQVLRYPRLQPLAAHPALPAVLAWLHRPEHVVIPEEHVRAIPADPAHDQVLEAALAGRADAVVSGDRHLLALRSFRGIPILTARAFAARHL